MCGYYGDFRHQTQINKFNLNGNCTKLVLKCDSHWADLHSEGAKKGKNI